MTQQPEATRPVKGSDRMLDNFRSVVDRLTAAARIDAAFGQPITQDNRTVIPAAETFCVFGFGGGGGPAKADAGAQADAFGGGGGGVARTRPIATIVIEPEGVSVRPVVDVTQIYLAALAAAVFALLWGRNIVRRGSRIEEGKELPSPRRLARLLRR